MGKDQHLIEASRNGDIKSVGKLLELASKRNGPLSSFRRSPNVNCQDVNGYTSLHHACLNGHSNIVRLLLAHKAEVDIPDVRGSTPLFLASWAGHQDIVKLLLMHSPGPANPNAQTIDNETALHSSAQHGHTAVVGNLLCYGADPTIRNNSFQTALDLAARFGRLQVVQTLLRTHPDLLEPYRVFDEDDSSLINGYATTPTKHIFTHTCLHLASRNGHKKVVETLLSAGLDVNILTHAGSALHEAALCGKKSVVVTLLKAGIDVNASDGNGRTALELLSDYPPHVTYDIVAVVNEFIAMSEDRLLRSKMTTNGIENGMQSLPKRLYEKNTQRQKHSKLIDPKLRKKQAHEIGLSHSLSSLDKYTTMPENYLNMKPIKLQKSMNDVSKDLGYNTYKPVYKRPYQGALLQGTETGGSVPSRSYEFINLTTTGSDTSSSGARNHSVDQYVEMSVPDPYADYANLPPRSENTTPTPLTSYVDSNNNNHNVLRNAKHSATPDRPPPTVSEAENAIFNFIQPLTLRRSGAAVKSNDSSTRTTTSISSDHVEEFLCDNPFAGLFKGSTLNLAQDNVRDALRSPSLVRSVNNEKSLWKQRYPTNGEDFSASKVWAEIDTIFEDIGNAVSNVEKLENLPADDIRRSLHIRNPVELFLDKSQNATSNWCHSPYTLIYGEIRYNVFYLGSTVIRQLQGTISTRKSIQKLKIDELSSVNDFNLLENCNTSTKYLKAANLETRLKVDIGVSYVGVKFIDHEKKTAICSHNIENINCVCQDAEDLRYFAYITKEQELHYCHVFMVDKIELAKEIILTLGQAFEVAYQLALNG